MSASIDARYWRWQVDGANLQAEERWRVRMIVDRAGVPVGYVPGESIRRGANVQIYGLAAASAILAGPP